MTARSTVAEKLHIGVETTPGTAVTADKRLRSIDMAPSPKMETAARKAAGSKFNTYRIPGREWMEYAISGVGDYEELTWLLNCVLDTGAITTPGGGTNARTHTFTPDLSALDALKTLTIEQGQAARAHRATFGRVTELGLEFDRNGITLSGAAQAQEMADGVTLNASPDDIAEAPILPTDVTVYLDSSSGGLGSTAVANAPKVAWKMAGRTNPVWYLDASQPSYSDQVESAGLACTMELTMAADAAGMAQVDKLRAGTRQFIRIEAAGAADSIESGVDYNLKIDAAVDVAEFQELGDMDGLYICRFMLDVVGDTTWGKAIEVALTNSVTAL